MTPDLESAKAMGAVQAPPMDRFATVSPVLAWLIVARAYAVGIVRARWLWALFIVCMLSSLATVLRSHHASIKHRETHRADVAAAMLQLMIALSVAALYPARPEQH